MWDNIVKWMSAATMWDWIWHIVAVVIVVFLSVPQLWWPLVEKYRKKNAENEQNPEQADQAELPR
jgi:membrane protein implicated in regulation of membrane protease activity